MTLLAKSGDDRVDGADTITAPLVDNIAGVPSLQSSGTQVKGDLFKVEVSVVRGVH